MKIVLVKHFGNDNPYIFATRVDLKKGDFVKVDTKYGVVDAQCVTNSIEVSRSDAKNITRALGGTKLKEVVGKYIYYKVDEMLKMDALLDQLREVKE